MRMTRTLVPLLALLLTTLSFSQPVGTQGLGGHGGRQVDQYDRVYSLGYEDGEKDARQGRVYDFDHDQRFQRGSDAFRRAYAEGYRAGFESRRVGRARFLPRIQSYGTFGRQSYGASGRGGYQDPAFSRGQSEGYRRGFEDGRDRDRYDPVRHGEYRSGDNGYVGAYGSRDAYKNNYRDGFRQGYEEGYRNGTRGARR